MFRDRDGWRVQWRAKGRRFSKTFASKKEAQIFELQLKSGLPGKAEPKTCDLTFAEYADRWLEDYCKMRKAKSQWVSDESMIRNHLTPALGAMKLRDIDETALEKLSVELRRKVHPKTGKPLRAKSLNLYLSLAKKMLQTAVRWKLIPENPAVGLEMFKVGKQPFGYWTPEERDFFLRFVRPLDPEFAELVLVACHTGMRRGELAGLERSQLDFERRQIQVSATFCFKAGERDERTKNEDTAWLPMNDAVFEALRSRKLLAPTDRVFKKEALLHASRKIGRLSRQVGVRPIRFHDCRHTFASCLVMAGTPLYTVQQLMRHKSLSQTERYAHLAPTYLHEAVAGLVARKGGTQNLERAVSNQ